MGKFTVYVHICVCVCVPVSMQVKILAVVIYILWSSVVSMCDDHRNIKMKSKQSFVQEGYMAIHYSLSILHSTHGNMKNGC